MVVLILKKMIMKKIIYILLISNLILLGGCYKDLGNYDYKEINEISVDFSPVADSYDQEHYTFKYVYRQPATDTLSVTYIPSIEQTESSTESDLVYEWIISKSESKTKDTLYVKELTLKFAPKVRTSYDVRFRVTDQKTDVSLFRKLSANTEVPFVKSWFVLHGSEGNRQLGTIEYPDRKEDAQILLDAYGEVHNTPNPFKNVNSMFYTASDGSDYSAAEHITLLEPEKAYYIHPFNLIISPRGYNFMVPDPSARLKLSHAVTNNGLGRYAAIFTEDGKLLHGGPNGFYHEMNTQPEISDYHADMAYISSNGYMTVWDNINKKLMYYNFGENWYTWYNGDGRPDGVSNSAQLTSLPLDLFSTNELSSKSVLWIGPSLDPYVEAGSTVIAFDQPTDTYWVYQINLANSDDKKGDDGGGSIKVTRQSIENVNFDGNTLFALSNAFSHQFFYTYEDILFLYNMVTGESTAVYAIDSGETFSLMEFREPHSHYMITNENHKLAIAVLSSDGTKGKLHEITLSQSADIIDEIVFDGDFGPIKDIDFTFIHRVIL